jgi:hypothetical protein
MLRCPSDRVVPEQPQFGHGDARRGVDAVPPDRQARGVVKRFKADL